MKNSNFDCVEMMHKGALRIYEETKDFTREQELDYWRRKGEASQSRREKLKEQFRKGREHTKGGHEKASLVLEQLQTLFKNKGPRHPANKNKTFDCVEMMHKAALHIHEETKDLTTEEKLEYWRRKTNKGTEE